MNVLAVLEVMWDWRAMTSRAGYDNISPRHYRINPDNHTGRRLYSWLDINPYARVRDTENRLLVTNACADLVGSASERGTPDPEWLWENITVAHDYYGFGHIDLLLVCGRVAQNTLIEVGGFASWIDWLEGNGTRAVFVPHPAARLWSKKSLSLVGRLIRNYDKHLVAEITVTQGQVKILDALPK